MSDDEEKVCLTAGQIENIGKAYARDIEGVKLKEVCPKASRWVKGFYGKKKKKKEKTVDKIIEETFLERIGHMARAKFEELF